MQRQANKNLLSCLFGFFAFPQFQLSAKGLLNQQSYQQIYTPIAQTNLIDEWLPIQMLTAYITHIHVTAYILYVTRLSDMHGAVVTYVAYVTPPGVQQ